MTRSVPELLQSHPASFSKTEWDLLRMNEITNGYGAKNQWFLKWLIARLAPSFREASANIHDFNFRVGGTEADRLRADQGFFIRLVRDGLQSRWLFLYYVGLAVVFYLAVRAFGHKYFKYTSKGILK